MVACTHAVARPRLADVASAVIRPMMEAIAAGGRWLAPVARRAVALRRLVPVVLALTFLLAAGWEAARLMDSGLLGFVFADLVFLVGVAMHGALASSGRPRTY